MSYWEAHGILLLVGLLILPRTTVIAGVWINFLAVSGGPLFWIGFLIIPRIFIACIACANYWETNPILCILAVMACIGGESVEKEGVKHGIRS